MIVVEAPDLESTQHVETLLMASTFPKDFAALLEAANLSTVGIRIQKEAPDEIELRGGLGEPFFVTGLPQDSGMALAGLCEGYELSAVISRNDEAARRSRGGEQPGIPGEAAVEDGKKLWSLRSGEVLASTRLQPKQHSIRLCFLSPFARLPRFSEKQLADRLGFRQIRQACCHRLVFELKFAWRPFKVLNAAELLKLRESTEREVLTADLQIDGLRLKAGWVLRFPGSLDFLSVELDPAELPETLEAGRPRDVQKLGMRDFQRALGRAGIHWLKEPEQMILLTAIQRERDELMSWEEDLADAFVIDSPGNFKRVSGLGLRLHHVFHVTRKIQEMLDAKSSAKAGMVDVSLSRSEFANAMDAGGINWLTQQQTDIIFRFIAGEGDEAGLTLNDWIGRFVWDTMEAATEVERVLEIWERRLAQRAKLLRRMSRSDKGLRPSSLSFWEFHCILTDMGVSWLTLRQQKLLFRGLDANRDGRIDTKELQSLSQKRSQIELWRMEKEEKKEKGSDRSVLEGDRGEAFADGVLKAGEAEGDAERQGDEGPTVEGPNMPPDDLEDLDARVRHGSAESQGSQAGSQAGSLYDDDFECSPRSPTSPAKDADVGDLGRWPKRPRSECEEASSLTPSEAEAPDISN